MFYYIKDGVIITISETPINQNEDILEIETNDIFENPFFENGKIVEYNQSQDFFDKQKQEEFEKQQELEKEELEKQQEFEKQQELEKDPEFQKQKQIFEIKDLGKQGEELRSKYLSAELLPESEIKTETLRILKEKGDLIMSQYVEKQKILVEKYGFEILQEIL